MLFVEADCTVGDTTHNNRQVRHTITNSPSNSHRKSIMSAFSFEQVPKRKLSYYSRALTEEDKQSLAFGEKNHNHKEWSVKDLVAHHEACKDLVPITMPKVDRIDVLAGIEHDKQLSQRALVQSKIEVGRAFSLWCTKILLLTDKGKERHVAYSESAQVSQSSFNSPSAPRRPSLPSSMSTPNFANDEAPRERSHLHARATSSGDYFSQRPACRTGAYCVSRISPLAVSGTSSGSSTHVRSPLAQEVQHRHNPEVTFDSFLTPHKSGKGETFKGADSVEKS